ncbi:MAG: hypothetical protein ACFFDN_17525, partial [Candidatus Hodarchaeota archaeon]
MIIGFGFLPGACIFNIFFHNNKLHERFKVESFVIKIVFYPIISFTFIGISVLIIDQLGVVDRNLFALILLYIILALFSVDIMLQKYRIEKLNFKNQSAKISKYTFLILLCSIGIIFITVGIHLSIHYIIPGDSWTGLTFTKYIGYSKASALEKGYENYYYPIFWCYIMYGFSSLCGLPVINTNTLLIPFNYLYIFSIYLLMKAILHNFKEKYSVCSTLLMSIFSALFYITKSSIMGSHPAIVSVGVFYFIYKSFSLVSLIVSLALFIIIINTQLEHSEVSKLSLLKIKECKLLFLSSFFLIVSFMLYGIPFLIGLIIIFCYCLVAEYKQQNLRFFSHFILFIILLFIPLDLLMQFYLSSAAYSLFIFFFQSPGILYLLIGLPKYVISYLFFFGLFTIVVLIQIIYIRFLKERKKLFIIKNTNPKKYFKICFIIFTIFLILEIISIILEEIFLRFYIDEKIIFFYYLDQIYLDIGFIGILATYLSYFCFKKNKELFYILIAWIFVIFLIASALIIINIIKFHSIFVRDINDYEFNVMRLWFSRIWGYSTIPICIIFSIGIVKAIKSPKFQQKFQKIFKNRNKRDLIKAISFSAMIYLSCSNLIITGIIISDAHNREDDEDIEIIGWMSEHLPYGSTILIEKNYIIRLGIHSFSYAYFHYISDYFESDDTNEEYIREISNLKDDDV